MKLVKLKTLMILHDEGENLDLLSITDMLPVNVKLNLFKLYQPKHLNRHKKYYSLSSLIKAWDPLKSKRTEVIVIADYELDIVPWIVEDRCVGLIPANQDIAKTVIDRLNNLQVVEFNQNISKYVFRDKET